MKKSIYLFVLLALAACKPHPTYDYKQEMRDFVCHLSAWAKTQKPSFLVIPQNGIELVTLDGTATGMPATSYLNAIDRPTAARGVCTGSVCGSRASENCARRVNT